MKILKFLSGGTPTVQAITNPFSAPLNQGASSAKTQSLIDDDLIKKLYEKGGIPVDVDSYLDKVAELERDLSMGLPVSAEALRSLYALGNRIILQANYLDSAEKTASKNDAIGEVAVGNSGGRIQLYVKNQQTNDIQHVDVTDYDSEKHGPAMTVNELIQHRKFNPTQAFDSTLTLVIGSNIGMNKISDFILNIIKTVGSTHTVSEAYTDLAGVIGLDNAKRPSEQQLLNLRYLHLAISELGEDAIFKNKQVLESKNMEEALSYIESVLPPDMKKLLIGRYVAYSNDYKSSGNYLKNIIAQSLVSSNDIKQENYINYDASLNKAAGTSAGQKESSKTFYLGVNEAFFDGDLNQTEILLSDNGAHNKYGIILKGNTAAALTTDNDNAVSNLPMNIAINNTIGKFMDKNYIYMGEQKLNGEADLANIAYGSDLIAQVYMPCTEDGAIDWEGFHRYADAEEYIKVNNITDPYKKNAIHQQMGSYVQYDLNNQIIPNSHVQAYLMTYGYTIDDHVDSENSMAMELQGDAELSADALLKAIYNKNMAKKTGYSSLPNKQFWDDIYKVPVFMKINKYAAQDAYRYSGHGSNLSPRTLQQDMVNQKMQEEPRVKLYGSSAALYQEDN